VVGVVFVDLERGTMTRTANAASRWRLVVGACTAAVIAACGGGDGSSEPGRPAAGPPGTPTEVVDGVVIPVAPPLSANATLGGVDSNRNGVRDDAERLLAFKFGQAGNSELLELARAYETFIVAPTGDPVALRDQFVQLEQKSLCLPAALLSAVPEAALWVRYSVLNNPERRAAHRDRIRAMATPDLAAIQCGA